MFVKGDDDVNFAYVAEVIDIGQAANVDHIGLMTPKIMAGAVRRTSIGASCTTLRRARVTRS